MVTISKLILTYVTQDVIGVPKLDAFHSASGRTRVIQERDIYKERHVWLQAPLYPFMEVGDEMSHVFRESDVRVRHAAGQLRAHKGKRVKIALLTEHK